MECGSYRFLGELRALDCAARALSRAKKRKLTSPGVPRATFLRLRELAAPGSGRGKMKNLKLNG